MSEDTAAGFEPASVHLEAVLLPRKGTLLTKALRTAASIAAGLMTNDMESGPSVIDLVVIRRETGAEVLRVSAGTQFEADRLLQQVRRDLETRSVAAFVAEWRTPEDSPPAPA